MLDVMRASLASYLLAPVFCLVWSLTTQCKLSAASSSLQKGAVKYTSPFQQYVDPSTPSFDLGLEVVRTGHRQFQVS